MEMSFETVEYRSNPACPVCGEDPEIESVEDVAYEGTCEISAGWVEPFRRGSATRDSSSAPRTARQETNAIVPSFPPAPVTAGVTAKDQPGEPAGPATPAVDSRSTLDMPTNEAQNATAASVDAVSGARADTPIPAAGNATPATTPTRPEATTARVRVERLRVASRPRRRPRPPRPPRRFPTGAQSAFRTRGP